MTALVDTDVFFAFYSLRDTHHFDSLGLITHLVEGRWGRAYITNHILDEVVNILKYRIAPETSRVFVEVFIDRGIVGVLYTDADLEAEALEVFRENLARKGFSYTDAVTVAAVRRFRIDYLLSFDLRSFYGLVDNIVGSNYWQTLSKAEKERILNMVQRGKR